MKAMKKRLSSLLLAFVLVLPAALPALAAEESAAPLTLGGTAPGVWYYDAARWAIAAGIARGEDALGRIVTAQEWNRMLRAAAPSARGIVTGELNRAKAVAALYALAAPAGGEVSARPFADVDPDSAYYDAILWARAAGISDGSENGYFAPEQPVTVEQAVTMLYRCFTASAEASVCEKRRVPVFRETASEETVELVFYSFLPNVAYVDINDYFRLFFPDGGIRAERAGIGVYTLTGPNGRATVDTQAETLRSDDLPAFTNLMPLTQEGMDNVYLDGMSYVRWEKTAASPRRAPVTLKLADYGIDLRADGEHVYFPIATLCDLYADLAYHFAFYSGEKVYVEDENLLPGPDERDGEDYTRALLDNLTRRAERPDLVRFNYNELCFAIDCFYGNPRPSAPLYALLGEMGLDAALRAYRCGGEPVGERVRELLLSADAAEYLYGMNCLGGLLYDGGHTAVRPILSIAGRENEQARRITEAYASCGARAENTALAAAVRQSDEDTAAYVRNLIAMMNLRAERLGTEETYFTCGNTAVCVFDTFLPGRVEAMAEYAAQDPQTRELPTAEDPTALFLDALQRAAADPEIENLVIDISQNGGGSLDIVMAMMSLLLGPDENTVRWKNTLTGQEFRVSYAVDRNFDGVFDERDREVDFGGLRFAVLTSGCSFSCGNLFPALMKDHGVMILGEQSGGGACAVQMMATADGFIYQISSARAMLLDREGRSIDGGVPADVELIPRNADGSWKTVEAEMRDYYTSEMRTVSVKDYSAFYDLEAVSAAVNAFYAEEKAA